MPTYNFLNSETNQVETHFCKMSELDDFKTNNPHLKQTLSTPSFGDSVRMGVTKTPDSFNSLLKNMKKSYPDSTIKTR